MSYRPASIFLPLIPLLGIPQSGTHPRSVVRKDKAEVELFVFRKKMLRVLADHSIVIASDIAFGINDQKLYYLTKEDYIKRKGAE